jgi:hypothetical protein
MIKIEKIITKLRYIVYYSEIIVNKIEIINNLY